MAQVIINIVPTTEIEAVNVMLAVIGEDPLPGNTDLSTASQADVGMAINILRNSAREVLSMGWRFNTEFGYELAPAGTIVWTDTAGFVTTLNVFTPPANLLAFHVTATAKQTGPSFTDVVVRPSRKYPTPPGIGGTLVFYDRAKNRDGFTQSDYPFLYIDPVWAFDFEKLPEEARRYILVRAARQFAAEMVGSESLVRFTQQDETLAFRNLKRQHGENDDYNIFKNMDVLRVLGDRRGASGVLYDPRKSPGPV